MEAYRGGKRKPVLIRLCAVAILLVFIYSMFQNNQKNEEIDLDGFANRTSKHLQQNDSRIINNIRKHHLFPPSTGGYHFDTFPKRAGKDPIAPYVAKLLKGKKNGFYVECGSNDGEFISNTLTLEINYGWTGLLVEADPQPLKKLLSRNRKAWVSNVCLAMKSYPHKVDMVRFNNWSPMSQILTNTSAIGHQLPGSRFSAQCFPLYSVLSALNITVVDYLGLDIEKVELDVLKTFPFKDGGIKITVISVEVEVAKPPTKNIKIDEKKAKPLIQFLEANGYKRMNYMTGDRYTHDLVFIRKDALG